jgi:adenosylcobyric acid synthase
VLGICGGYQMLGRTVADPEGIEGPPSRVEGLGLLDVETVLGGTKVLVEVTGRTVGEGVPFKGYEMHVGRTTGSAAPLLALASGTTDGAIDANGRVAGCYIHGLLADDRQRRHWLARLGAESSGLDYETGIEATLDRLADHLEQHVDCAKLLELARVPSISRTG